MQDDVNTIDRGRALEWPEVQGGLSLVFAAGTRPAAADVEHLLGAMEPRGAGARISFPPPAEEGWIELLASGLAFDLSGLAPAEGRPVPAATHFFGLDAASSPSGHEAIVLAPGNHISGKRAVMPVVRTMVGLAAGLALPLGAKAVCWHQAESWMEPAYFARVALNWLSGGAFPALGLTALKALPDGGVASVGLGYFCGQEIELDALPGESQAMLAKLAVRIIDHLVRTGPIRFAAELRGPSDETLIAEPSGNGERVRIRRTA